MDTRRASCNKLVGFCRLLCLAFFALQMGQTGDKQIYRLTGHVINEVVPGSARDAPSPPAIPAESANVLTNFGEIELLDECCICFSCCRNELVVPFAWHTQTMQLTGDDTVVAAWQSDGLVMIP